MKHIEPVYTKKREPEFYVDSFAAEVIRRNFPAWNAETVGFSNGMSATASKVTNAVNVESYDLERELNPWKRSENGHFFRACGACLVIAFDNGIYYFLSF